ncbi:hypothetical protein QBC46DRAFT_382601 [Diplogelasinospora grovesii]|uniref:Apple domain-containing protein n=1 Tax=Diplogelasinospora grovesii TaxID=303347 RepID=A0AAN6NBU7_9PEZI|nr:hypothetical protein QBC46DRAFT_382601 [Diplogelasinospora grovesii]
MEPTPSPKPYSSPQQYTSPHEYQDGLIPTEGAAGSYPEVVTAATSKPLPTISDQNTYHQPPWTNNDYPQSTFAAPPSKQVSTLKRALVATVVIAVAIIAVLAGILGGVASGSIKTSGNSSSNPQAASNQSVVTTTATVAAPGATGAGTGTSASGTSATPTPSTSTISTPSGVVTVECPSADNLNYTAPGTQRVFRRMCDVNFSGGEGDLGLQSTVYLNIQDCMDECALHSDCVGVVWNPSPQCWLKQFMGIKTADKGSESAMLWQ